MDIYLDNSATTKVCPEAVSEMMPLLSDNYGNPSALHFKGAEANEALETARKRVAAVIGAKPCEVYFSHSGTLANNTAVLSYARAMKKRGTRVVTTSVEHPSVANCFSQLEAEGFEVIRVAPRKDGGIALEDMADAINEKTVLVSVMLVNNETGIINPVGKIKSVITKNGSPALLHTDAVQGFGKLPFRPGREGVDLMTASGHKIHGPKGVGALWVRQGVTLRPLVLGGGQENGMFSGTEPMPAIAGFGAAAKALGSVAGNLGEMKKKNGFLRSALAVTDGVGFISPEDALPYILNMYVSGIPSQVLINYLSAKGICISAGSACSKGHRSPVLTAMGIAPSLIDSAVRVSMSRFTTEEELELFASAVKSAREEIRVKL